MAGKPSGILQQGFCRGYIYKAAETFIEGAMVVADGTPEVTECGANPSLILGMALEGAATDPYSTLPVGAVRRQLVAEATETALFWMPFSTAPLASDVLVSYGVTKDSDGVWFVDKTKTAGNARVQVRKIDTVRVMVLVNVLAANRQLAP